MTWLRKLIREKFLQKKIDDSVFDNNEGVAERKMACFVFRQFLRDASEGHKSNIDVDCRDDIHYDIYFYVRKFEPNGEVIICRQKIAEYNMREEIIKHHTDKVRIFSPYFDLTDKDIMTHVDGENARDLEMSVEYFSKKVEAFKIINKFG